MGRKTALGAVCGPEHLQVLPVGSERFGPVAKESVYIFIGQIIIVQVPFLLSLEQETINKKHSSISNSSNSSHRKIIASNRLKYEQ